MLENINSFIAIGAHCDDVDLRMGGTFSRLIREGKRGCYVVAIENSYVKSGFPVENSREALAVRRRESTAASEILGAQQLEWLEIKSYYFSSNEPHSRIVPSFSSFEKLREEMKDVIYDGLPQINNADHFPECTERLCALIDEAKPDAVFTHSPDDRHQDHYGLSRFVEKTIRGLNDRGAGIQLFFWEPGSGGPIVGFRPNAFVELSEDDISIKQRAIDVYASQFPEEISRDFAVKRTRAYGSLIGVEYAEAFHRGYCKHENSWEGESGFISELLEDRQDREIHYL